MLLCCIRTTFTIPQRDSYTTSKEIVCTSPTAMLGTLQEVAVYSHLLSFCSSSPDTTHLQYLLKHHCHSDWASKPRQSSPGQKCPASKQLGAMT